MVKFDERIVARICDGMTHDEAISASDRVLHVVKRKFRLRVNCDIVLVMVKSGRVAISKRDDGTSSARTLGGCGDVDYCMVVSITTTIAARDTQNPVEGLYVACAFYIRITTPSAPLSLRMGTPPHRPQLIAALAGAVCFHYYRYTATYSHLI